MSVFISDAKLLTVLVSCQSASFFMLYVLDSLFSAVENFTVAAGDFHQRLDQLDTSKYG